MISVHADGEDRHRLEDGGGQDIGWIRGRVIGFRGMRSEGQAVDAVRHVWPVFEAALRRSYFGLARLDVGEERLRLVHDGAYEWVASGQQPLARLYRPRSDRRHDSFAIELVLPSYANEGVAIAVAQVVGNALQAHLAEAGGSHPIERSPESESVTA